MSYLKDREIWLSKVPTGNPPAGFFWKFIQNGKVVVRDSNGNDQMMIATNGNQAITGSLIVTGGITGTISSASYVQYSNVANKPTLVSGSSQVTFLGLSSIPSGIVSGSSQVAQFGYATTGSNGFNGSQSITGSLTVTGQVIAQTLNVQQVTSSIVYSSGSNVFGNNSGNTHRFTGSLQVSGSSHYLLGNLGVGSVNPVKTFEVRGTLAISNNAASYWYMDRDDSDGRFKILTDTDNERFSIATTGAATLTGALQVGGNSSSTITVGDAVASATDANIRLRTGSTRTSWLIGAQNNVVGFEITPSTTVGGTTYSTPALSILASTGAATFSSSVTANGTMSLSNDGTYGSTYKTLGFTGNSNGSHRIFAGTADNIYIAAATARGIQFWVNGTNDAMYIASGGSVGIGTISPLGPLEVRAANRAVSSDGILQVNTTNSQAIDLGGSLTFGGMYQNSGTIPTEWAGISGRKENGTNGNYAGYLSLGTRPMGGVITEQMRITSGGNVGIGTITPINRLEVKGLFGAPTTVGNAQNGIARFSQTSGGGSLDIGFGDPYSWMQSRQSADYSTNYALALNPNGGNVLIGTTTDNGDRVNISGAVSISSNIGVGRGSESGVRLSISGAGTSNAAYVIITRDSLGNDLFYARNDGLINTGTRAASPYNNSTSGRTMVIESNGTLGYTSSTLESKTNIQTLANVSWLYDLNPVSFNYRKKDNEMHYTEEYHDEKWYGLIADEVENINEDLVFYNIKENGDKELAGVEYQKITSALVKALQEQQTLIESLKSRIEILEQ